MNIKKLILEAYDQGIRLTLKDDSLVAVTTAQKMSDALRARIKEHKAAIIDYLKTQSKHNVVLDEVFAPIPVAPSQESYPIPTSLFRIWVLSQFKQGNVAYNMPGAIDFTGAFHLQTFEKAFHHLITRHEILRTVFRESDAGEVRQYVRTTEDIGFKIECNDLRAASDGEKILKARMADLVVQPFDLTTGPLLRAHIFQMSEKRHVFFFNMHHIINDGWSMEVFINEIFHLYNAFHNGIPIGLDPLRIQYKDYTLWQLAQLQGSALEAHRSYWLDQFSGEIPVLNIPSDFVRPAVQTYQGSIIRTSWSAEMTSALHAFVKSQDGTPFMGLLASVYALLYRYTAQQDIVIGSPTAGRTHSDLENQLGFYVNTLALRARFEGSQSFAELFRHVKEITLAAFDHQIYPFGDLVDELNLSRDISRSPLFDVMLVLHNNDVKGTGETTLGDLEAHHYNTDYVTSKFDLSFYFKEVNGEMKVSIEYNIDIFSATQIEMMLTHFGTLVTQMVAHANQPLLSFDYLTASETKQQLEAVLHKPVTVLPDKTILDLFRQQVKAYPDRVALHIGEQWLTYAQLNTASDKFADFLSNVHRLKKEELVGVMLPLGMDYVISILGILKAGGAYVPIETSYPFQRVKGMIEDAQIRLLVTQNEYNETADHLQWECNSFPAYITVDNNNVFNEAPDDAEKESRDLWDYVAHESDDDIIKAGGWINSYSGDAFTAEEMEEFSDNVKRKLEDRLDKSKKVLEIGCGSGLILRKIAPHVGTYVATDISPALVNKLSRYASEEGLDNLMIHCLSATQVHTLGHDKFDVIILNSVVQYFKGHGYLRNVIEQCMDLLASNGTLFLGDIMDLDSRKALIDEHIAYKSKHKDASTKLDFSSELFLSKAYFENLYTVRDDISSVKTSSKYATLENELTAYRYDVLITKGVPIDEKKITHTQRYYKSDIDKQKDAFTSPVIATDALAYVTYTSGSTGVPKGVMISHGNVVSFLANYEPVFCISPGMSVGALTNISFDIAVLELIGSLCLGMEVVFLSGNNPVRLAEEIRNNRVDVLQLTPSRLQQLMFCSDTLKEDLSKVKVLLVGGEALSEIQFNWLKSLPNTRVLNVYGPTEATVWSSALVIQSSNSLSIGQPLVGEQMYVLDAAGKLVPRGVIGEIFIGGSGLSRGYLKRPELTSEKFIQNPYNKQERIYATGDLGRWLPDGNLAFVGRKDNQVKVRGYRIELGEIENALLNYATIKAAVVLALKGESSEHELIAFVIANQAIQEEDMRRYLKDLLPDYMIPAAFVQLDSFPLLPSGKVDRKQLRDATKAAPAVEKLYVKPRHKTDEKLLMLWSEVLGTKAELISINDSFFHLGGHSLKATRLMSMINKEFNVGLLLNDLFSKVTIADQSDLVLSSKGKEFQRIPVLPEQDSYVVSSPQLRLWILSQFEAGNVAYNMPGIFRIEGDLREALFQLSFIHLIRRHEILRTVFREENGEVRQVIQHQDQVNFNIETYDLRGVEGAMDHMELEIDKRKLERFNLETGPLLKACLYRLEERRYVFFFNMHHIISDGWSMEVFIRELIIVYNALRHGQVPHLEPLPIQYKDYAHWQRQQLVGENLAHHRNYWLEQFAGELPILDLPEDYVRPEVMTYRGSEVKGYLNESTSRALQSVVKQNSATVFMGLLAGVNALFCRYTGAEDIIIGSPLAGRDHVDLENQLGFYVNTLAFRTQFSRSDSFSQLLRNVKEVTLGAYDHQGYPFDQLIDDLKLSRDISRPPLFNVMVILQNNEKRSGEMTFDDLAVRTYESKGLTSKFDITFIFTEIDSEIHFVLEYNADIYSSEQMERLAAHCTSLMTGLTRNDSLAIGLVDYLLPDEKKKVINEFNQTDWTYDSTQTLVSLFETHVQYTPEKVAVVFEDTSWTYQQINGITNQLAAYLQHHYRIMPDDLVAIQLSRSPWMVIAMLAIIKSGGAYVPIDPDFPEERIQYIRIDSQCKILLDSVVLEDFQAQQHLFSALNNDHKPLPQHLAYVIYTSGSTGRPKGVMIEHRSVVSFFQNLAHVFTLTENHVVGAATNFTFDISVLELLGTLCTGATCYLLDEKDPSRILSLIRTQKIQAFQLTPSRLKQFFAADTEALAVLSKLDVLLVGGEALSSVLYDSLKRLQKTRVINVYGPTETTIWSSCHVLGEGGFNSIGTPLLNERIYILDKDRKPVPPRVNGELYIAGLGLARGYHNKNELTAAKFVDDPFVEGGKMYCTGDIGRWLVNGEIVFAGRTDDQVKVRGYRIELGEIESVLLNYEGIKSCVITIVKNDEDANQLAAYLVGDDELNVKDIRMYVEHLLPGYMIPSFFVQLDALPLTASGKVNVKSLPAPTEADMTEGGCYVAPEKKSEEILVRIWSEILNLKHDEIGVQANFFDLGGNSINAIRLIAQVNDQFNLALPLITLFQYSTVASLSEVIDSSVRPLTHSGLVPIQPEGDASPLFLVAGTGGFVMGFYPLVHAMGTICPIYGLEPKGIEGDEDSLATVEELATYYIGAIQKVQQKGPYRLLGHSFGAYVVFEMAAQLNAMGEEVSQLFLLDTGAPSHEHMQLPGMTHDELKLGLLHTLQQYFDWVLPMDNASYLQLEESQQHALLRQYLENEGIDITLEQVRGYANVFVSQGATRYIPQQYLNQTQIVLFKTAEMDQQVIALDSESLGWELLSRKKPYVHDVPGTHISMLKKENIGVVAEHLKEYLQEDIVEDRKQNQEIFS